MQINVIRYNGCDTSVDDKTLLKINRIIDLRRQSAYLYPNMRSARTQFIRNENIFPLTHLQVENHNKFIGDTK